jgi:hypothetical protein
MESKLQFQQNANVVAANGRPVGQIERVVVHPESKAVSHIVVRTGSLLKKEERVVPVSLIAATDEERITLREDAGNLDSLPPFEEKRMVPREGQDLPPEPGPVLPAANVYGAPLVGLPAQPPPSSGEEFVKRTEQNIPEGSVAMKEGAKVITADGKAVGNVERLVADAPADQATYLVVSLGNLGRDRKLVPIDQVSLIDENQVHLSVEGDSLKELADA